MSGFREPAPSAGAELLSAGVLVVGAGLIGTSVALALRRHDVPVHVSDRDPVQEGLAVELGAGRAGLRDGDPALVVVAVPATAVALVVQGLSSRYLTCSFTDVASVKTQVQVDIEALGPSAARFVGGHPMAGRERSGAAVADPELF